MKIFLRKFLKFINVLYKILPFFIGLYCYYSLFTAQDGHIYPFWDSVYASLKLYGGDMDEGVAVGGLLQFARFLALAVSFTVLMNIFNKMGDLVNRLKLQNSGSIVVYGDSDYAGYVYKSLNPRFGIRGGEKFIRNASKYFLMFTGDEENLAFYNRHYEELKDKNVYIMLEDISRQNIENPLIMVFNIAENCARQYWKDYPVLESEKIAIIGFENVGENILLYGLQMNIINPGQHFTYHIYGDAREFRREHTKMDKMSPDEIIFHDDGVYTYEELEDFDRIIICGSGDDGCNIVTASKLLASASFHNRIYIYTPNGDIVTRLFGKDRLICFGTAEEMISGGNIIDEASMKTAREQHESYVRQYGGTPWVKLDAFKRYSNVSSSDYMCTVKRLMEKGVSMEILAELEHIRWCRYYYIHNWEYGPVRNDSRRIHNSLIPFSELSEEEKLKDVESIENKFQGNQ